MKKINCLYYNGCENDKLRISKENIKNISSNLSSFVRISTCHRIELYTDQKLNFEVEKRFRNLHSKKAFFHLIKILSGIDSNLFGEIEIYKQVLVSYESSKRQNHISNNLDFFFKNCFNISKKIRKEFSLNNSWVKKIRKSLGNIKKIYIYGNGSLSNDIKKNFNDDFKFLDNYENAEAIIILKENFNFSEINSEKLFINLTDKPSR